MKKSNIKIVFSLFLFLSVLGLGVAAMAASPYLYVAPTGLTKNVGDSFDLSAGVSASESKIYAVEGTLTFNNLNCVSIAVANGITAQTSPTCANPYFLLGIPLGATADKTLFTISVNAQSAGDASVNFSGVDIIGEGKSISSASVSGSYTIESPAVVSEPSPVLNVAEPKPAQTPENTNKPVQTTPENNLEVLPVENVSTTTAPEENLNNGRVLAETEQATPSEQKGEGFFGSTLGKIIIGLAVLIIILFIGRKIIKKDKNKQI